jgi:hypothetical protein
MLSTLPSNADKSCSAGCSRTQSEMQSKQWAFGFWQRILRCSRKELRAVTN